jgi:ubiquinone/menaquinone biosynthesis C-methylase UbiE
MSSASLWANTEDVAYMARQGRADHPSHDTLTSLLRDHYPDRTPSLLDCGVMSGVTYEKLRGSGTNVNYTGIDIGEVVLAECRERHPGATWLPMSVSDLAFPDNSFDVVNCRHLLEHLPYYTTAVREAFRVARTHVVLCLFQVPKEPEKLLRRETPDGYIWLNRYAPGPLKALLESLSGRVEQVDVTEGRRTDRVYLCTKSS